MTLRPFAIYAGTRRLADRADRAARRAHPDHDRRPAVGDRHRRHGPARAAQRARDVAAARSRPSGDVDVLLLDKTGTITLGNRQATEFVPVDGVSRARARRGRAARVARRRDAGGSLDRRARQGALRPARARARRRARPSSSPSRAHDAHERRRPSTARRLRKGAADAVKRSSTEQGGRAPPSSTTHVERVARAGGTPLVVARDNCGARRHPPQGHRQGRHERALRRAAQDGHPHRDDHRRQPRHRRRDRRGGRRRRLPRRGDARGEDGADQGGAGARAAWSR